MRHKNNKTGYFNKRVNPSIYLDHLLTIPLSIASQNRPEEICEACELGKSHRLPFPKKTSIVKAHSIMDIVHSDVCGPMPVPTHDGFRYYVSFIDEKSKFAVIYLIQRKDQVFEKLKSYIALVKNKFNRNIQILRSDNGGEYIGNEFKNYCDENGIERQFSAPYTPEQNGVAERLNRTLMEKTRTILLKSKLPLNLWGEALKYCIPYISEIE